MTAPIGQLAGHSFENGTLIVWGHPYVADSAPGNAFFIQLHMNDLVEFNYNQADWDLICSLEENYSMAVSIIPGKDLFIVEFINNFDDTRVNIICRSLELKTINRF
jgi:hypothetical protein